MGTTRKTLIDRIRDRDDATAWREFNCIYWPLLVRYGLVNGLPRADAEDIAQQCLSSISNCIAEFKYDPARGRFRTWLWILAGRTAVEHLRKRRDVAGRTEDSDPAGPFGDAPDEHWDRQWEKEHLRFCWERLRPSLPPAQLDAFQLHALEKKPAKDVAAMLGVTENQVRLGETRVLDRMREMMIETFGAPTADY